MYSVINVFGHEASFGTRGLGCLDRTSKAKLADLQITIGVEKCQLDGLKSRWKNLLHHIIG